jgi:hypothetical protein
MHALFSGVVKRLMEYWFDSRYKDEKFSLFKKLKLVDKYMAAIKKPSFVTKSPRSIEKSFCYFTTAEFKDFFFYYSLPVLSAVGMDEDQFHHYFLLVHGVTLLHQEFITQMDLILAESYLEEFHSQLGSIYGAAAMTFNAHSVLHLAECVRRLGPLFEYDCFPKENLNGQMKRWLKGTGSPDIKIMEFLCLAQTLPLELERINEDSEVLKVFNSSKNRGKPKVLEQVDAGLQILGFNYFKSPSLIRSISKLLAEAKIPRGRNNFLFFQRIRMGGTIYTTRSYTRGHKSASYAIQFSVGTKLQLGYIEYFFKMSPCTCKPKDNCLCQGKFFAVVRVCKVGNIRYIEKNKFNRPLAMN